MIAGKRGKALRIGIDLAPLTPPLTGVGNYELQLLAAVLARSDSPEFFGFGGRKWSAVDTLYLRQIEDCGTLGSQQNSQGAKARLRSLLGRSGTIRSLYAQLRRYSFERATIARDLTAFHAFAYLAPGKSLVPMISVVYDLSFVRFPEMHPPERVRGLRDLARQLESAAAVHTISNFSAQEIAEVFAVNPSRIHVIYPGVNPFFARPLATGAIEKLLQYQVQAKHYFLAVSTLEPRKNLRSLVFAYSRLPEAFRKRTPLCVVGAHGWGALNLPPQADALKREGTLRFLGFVPTDDLRALYTNASALFYPSLYEGFGMPIIEALACGTTVICSNAASMPEAAGKVARLVAPLDVESWTREFQYAAEQPIDAQILQKRQQHAARFAWAQSAGQIMELYHTLSRPSADSGTAHSRSSN